MAFEFESQTMMVQYYTRAECRELLPGLSDRMYYAGKFFAEEGGILSAKNEPVVIHRDRLKPEATKGRADRW